MAVLPSVLYSRNDTATPTASAEPAAPVNYHGPARNLAQLCRAFALVHKRYVEFGYMEEQESGMRYSLLNLLPQATTFVVEDGPNVLGTLTVVVDSKAGMPAESEFGPDFDGLRQEGRILAEATMFACDETIANKTTVSMQLMALAYHWCVEIGVDDLCLIVNPKHVGFYEKTLGFERLGTEKAMPHVEGNAGILLRCNIEAIVAGYGKITSHGQRLLNATQVNGTLTFHRFTMLDVEVSVLLDASPETFFKAPEAQRSTLEQYFALPCALLKAAWGVSVSLEELYA